MPDAPSTEPGPTKSIPIEPTVVDLAVDKDPQKALHAALSAFGFVAIRNAGVSAELRDQAFASARNYFDQPATTKRRDLYKDTEANFGYQGMGSEALNPGQARHEADLKEAFTMRNLSNRAQLSDNKDKTKVESVWEQSEFGQLATRLHQSCSEVALHLLSLIAEALGSAPDTFEQHHTGENMTLRYLHYPAIESGQALSKLSTASLPAADALPAKGAHKDDDDKKMPQLGAGAHTDYGTITLLFSDGVAGLQLYDVSARSSSEIEGCWRDVLVAPGDVLVNTGDLMSLWSNGLYPSTLHRVQPRLEKPDRYSMAFFVDPDSSTRVSPLPSCIGKRRELDDELTNNKDAHPISTNVVVAGEHIQARIEASQRTLA